MRKLIIFLLINVITVNLYSQKQTVQIKTSAECEGTCCKDRIEKEMQFTKGVTAVNLDIETQVLSITFRTKKNSVENIRTIISNIGYDADDVKANRKANDDLPSCCQHLEFIDPEN